MRLAQGGRRQEEEGRARRALFLLTPSIYLLSIPVVCALASTVPVGADPLLVVDRDPVSSDDALPGERLRTVMVRQYTLSGRIRPLLFWFGRDNIGMARLVWRRDDRGARGYELLVGTDPARAPRSLNRWGYIAEEVLGSNGAMLALMTGADEVSYDEAEASTTRSSSTGDFRAIRARVHDADATWRVATVQTSRAFTIHDVVAALDRVRRDTATTAPRARHVPARARPGFLVALADLIDEVVGVGRGRTTADELKRLSLEYLFGQRTYELRVRAVRPDLIQLGGQPTPVVQASFEIRTPVTNARTRFEITCGTDGGLAGVPVAMEWQPRWWLKVGLRLDESEPAS
jgi:hypothetical protein